MILEAVRRTDENGIRQHSRESAAIKMDETIETDRETIETDEKWQMVNNPRSNKIQKTNTHAPTTTMSFFGQTIPKDSRTSGVQSYFSFGGNDTRTKPTSPQHGFEKSSSGDHRDLLKKEERERIHHRSNWNSTLTRNQMRFKYSTID